MGEGKELDLANNKSLSIMQLKMADKMQYLRKSTAVGTWDNIKQQFDKQGLALIFVDFRAAVNFYNTNITGRMEKMTSQKIR